MTDARRAETAPVRPGEELDWAALEALPAGQPARAGRARSRPLQFPNGAANLTYLLRFGDTELVLRRPPFGVVAPGAHDMKREYRVLSKLWQIFDRAPRAYLFCDDHAVIGSDFVVMERRRGEVVRDGVPASMADHDDVGRRIVVRPRRRDGRPAPARPGRRRPRRRSAGPTASSSARSPGWQTRWELVRPDDGPPRDGRRCPARLAATLPAPTRVSFVHNDLKLDNCQFDPADPDRVQSIFDWDMTTLGEPLIDLGTLLNYWPDPADPPDAGRVSHAGPARDGPADAGRDRRRATPSAPASTRRRPRWYEAFAQWKTGVVVQQLHRRWERGESTDPRMETIADRLPLLATTASRLLDELGVAPA